MGNLFPHVSLKQRMTTMMTTMKVLGKKLEGRSLRLATNCMICWEFGQIFVGSILDDDTDEPPINLERVDAQNFDKLFIAAQRKAYPGCAKTILAFIVEMLHVKVYKKLTNEAFDLIMKIIKGMVPDCDETVPWNIYEAKKFLRDSGLGYVPIHACINDRALFWKENASLENCP